MNKAYARCNCCETMHVRVWNKAYACFIFARQCMYVPKAVCMYKTYARFIFTTQVKRMLTVILARQCVHVLAVCVHE
jgi:hypothetical protein